jgi:chloride channel 3/4/5
MRPVFSSQLSDITPRIRPERIIDITDSVLVPADELRSKLRMLQAVGEFDGGLPIVKNGTLVGLIPAPDLEFALDNLQNPEEDELCLMAPKEDHSDGASDDELHKDPTDFSPYIDPAPVALERHSPMELVYECFAKLGLRYMCVLRDGQFAGVVCPFPVFLL